MKLLQNEELKQNKTMSKGLKNVVIFRQSMYKSNDRSPSNEKEKVPSMRNEGHKIP
jgi:hypothetical protein